MQIYCDFSGYTDIAIGLALLLGFRFPQNFDAPYTARNLQDFWRRWHMTLSRWLRDYLYIPLGGSAGSQANTVRNIMITMMLGGLWHGAAWTFVVWGTLQGLGQSFGHLRRTSRERRGLPAGGRRSGADLGAALPDLPVRVPGLGVLQRDRHVAGLHPARPHLHRVGERRRRSSRRCSSSPSSAPSPLQFVPPLSVDRLQAAFSRQRTAVQVGVLGFALLGITTFGPVGVAPFIYYRF